jgi:4-nitrophenyl phosphatase
MAKDDFSVITPDPSVGAVLCGFDVNISEVLDSLEGTSQIDIAPDYKKLCKAFSYLRDNEGCEFILTNQDPTYPTTYKTGNPDEPTKTTIFPGQSYLRCYTVEG